MLKKLEQYYSNVELQSVEADRIYFAADDAEEMQAVIESDSIVFYVKIDEDWHYADSAILEEDVEWMQ